MLHKSLIAVILADILYLVYCSMQKGMIPIWTLLVLVVGGALFYVMTAFISDRMVRKGLGDDSAFTVKAGMIRETEMVAGVLSVSNGMLMFHVRKSDLGGVKLSWSAEVSSIESYSMGKVDEYHMGVSIKLEGEESPRLFSSKRIGASEAEFRKALGWPEEDNSEEN